MANLTQDLRYGLRQIRRSPSFFAIAAVLIAMGIAATTQIFTLLDALLLKELPVRNPYNLVQLFEQQPKRPADTYFHYGFYRRLSRDSSTLSELAGQIEITSVLEWNGHTERIHTVAVTDEFFSRLGLIPLIGRVLGRGDTHAAVLSYSYWSRSFGCDSRVLGQTVRLQGHPYMILGVTPPDFTGTTVDSSPDLWISFASLPEFSKVASVSIDQYVIEIIARLRPGITAARAQQETAALWTRYLQETGLRADDSAALKRGRLEVRSIAHGTSLLREQSGTALVLLLAGTGLLLLMVCANVGGLLLSRVSASERDTAVRIALGAGRRSILRQWILESLLLTAIGGSAGAWIAYAGMPLLMRWMPPARGAGFDAAELRTLALHPSLDFRVGAFTLALFALTVLLCAVAPAWKSWHSDVNLALKTTLGDRRGRLFQPVLCGIQIALCTMLVACAGLIDRSLSNLLATDPGFDRNRVTVFSIDPHVRNYDSRKNWSVQQRLMNEVRNLPGVDGAALAERALMRGIGLGTAVVFPGQRGDGIINTSVNSVTPEYFGVMGMRVLSGRNFGPSDMTEEDKPENVVVNEAFVEKFLNGRNPLGARFATGRSFVESRRREIIGVVNDTKYRSLREVPPPIVYTYGFGPGAYPDTFILHVRTHGDPHAIIEPVRRVVRSIDPELPLYQAATVSDEIDRSLWQERLLMTLSSCFSGFALVLSCSGLYGIMSYFVARRQREIGLHVALGATWRNVIWLVIRRAVPTFATGVLGGLVLSWFVSAWVRSILYGVRPLDPTSNAAAILFLIAIASGAAALPVLRAVRVDPASTLRQE